MTTIYPGNDPVLLQCMNQCFELPRKANNAFSSSNLGNTRPTFLIRKVECMQIFFGNVEAKGVETLQNKRVGTHSTHIVQEMPYVFPLHR